MARQNKSVFGSNLRVLQSGVQANFMGLSSFVIGGTEYTPASLLAKIDAFIAVQTNATNAKNAHRSALAAEKASNEEAHTLRAQLQSFAIARYGKENPILSEFNFDPAKPKKTTAATKAVAVLKLKATREARHTMGKKERKKIKGAVDPSVVAKLSAALEGTAEGTENVG